MTATGGRSERLSPCAGHKSRILDTVVWEQARKGARVFSAGADPVRLLTGVCMAGDFVAMTIPAGAAHSILHPALTSFGAISATLLGLLMTLVLLRSSGAYTRMVTAGLTAQLAEVIQVWLIAFTTLCVLGLTTNDGNAHISLWVATWSLGTLLGFCLVRLIFVMQVRIWRRRGRLTRIVAVVDATGKGEPFGRKVTAETDAHLLGVFSARGADRGGIEALLRIARTCRVDDIFVTGSGGRGEELAAVLRKLGTIPANVHICTSLPASDFPLVEPGIVFGHPVVTVYRRPLIGWGRLTKRAEDLILAALLLVLLAPFMLAIGVIVSIGSPGPALFRQRRLGFNNNEFEVLKFRTMHYSLHEDPDVPQARRADPRVTRIGASLRRTSLDELPQLLNVLRGEMSLVGPRPHALPHNEHYASLIDGYLGRHRVLPGITGWAQVHGLRGETDTVEKMRRRVEFDLAYVEKWSLLLDLKILLCTVKMCFHSSDAY